MIEFTKCLFVNHLTFVYMCVRAGGHLKPADPSEKCSFLSKLKYDTTSCGSLMWSATTQASELTKCSRSMQDITKIGKHAHQWWPPGHRAKCGMRDCTLCFIEVGDSVVGVF